MGFEQDNPALKMEKIPFKDNTIEFEDTENFKFGSTQKGTSRREIILNQYNKCVLEGSKEMTFGGVVRKFINGQVMEFSVPNQREIYINSVDHLKILLSPELRDEDYKLEIQEDMVKFYEKQRAINEEYAQRIGVLNERYYKDLKRDSSVTADYNDKLIRAKNFKEGQLVELYREELLDILTKIMSLINFFDDEYV